MFHKKINHLLITCKLLITEFTKHKMLVYHLLIIYECFVNA